MMQRYIVTAFGHDRIGILSEVTGVLYRQGCNLEDSVMTRLSSEVAVIMLFSSSREDIEEILTREFRRLEVEKGLPAYFRRIRDKPSGLPSSLCRRSLHIEGIDKCGIIYHVSSFLADNNISISHMQSSRHSSPLSGTAIYHIELEIEIPPEMDFGELSKELRQLGDRLHIDIQIH